MSFAERFKAGSDIAKDLISTYRDSKERRELGDISKSKMTEDDKFDEDTAKSLDTAARQTKEDGTATFGINPNKKGGYDAVANTTTDDLNSNTVSRAGEVVTEFNPKKSYTFMGKTQDKPFTEAEQTKAKERASIEVLAKRDPKLGLTMRAAAAAEDRAEKTFAMTQEAGGLQLKAAKRNEDSATAIEASNEVVRKYNSTLVDANGTQRPPTSTELVYGLQLRAQHLFQAGRPDEGEKAWSQATGLMTHNIAKDTAARKQAFGQGLMALDSGDTNPLKVAYNNHVPDGNNVTDIVRNANGTLTIKRTDLNGGPLPDQTLTREQLAKNIEIAADPAKLITYASQEAAATILAEAVKRKAVTEDRDHALKVKADGRASAAAAQSSNPGQRKIAEEEAILGRKLTPAERERLSGVGKGNDKGDLAFATDIAKEALKSGTVTPEGAPGLRRAVYNSIKAEKQIEESRVLIARAKAGGKMAEAVQELRDRGMKDEAIAALGGVLPAAKPSDKPAAGVTPGSNRPSARKGRVLSADHKFGVLTPESDILASAEAGNPNAIAYLRYRQERPSYGLGGPMGMPEITQ